MFCLFQCLSTKPCKTKHLQTSVISRKHATKMSISRVGRLLDEMSRLPSTHMKLMDHNKPALAQRGYALFLWQTCGTCLQTRKVCRPFCCIANWRKQGDCECRKCLAACTSKRLAIVMTVRSGVCVAFSNKKRFDGDRFILLKWYTEMPWFVRRPVFQSSRLLKRKKDSPKLMFHNVETYFFLFATYDLW